MPQFLDEDMMGRDTTIVGFPHLLVCMGFVLRTNADLWGVHLTDTNQTAAVVPQFWNWATGKGLAPGAVTDMYGCCNHRIRYGTNTNQAGVAAWTAEIQGCGQPRPPVLQHRLKPEHPLGRQQPLDPIGVPDALGQQGFPFAVEAARVLRLARGWPHHRTHLALSARLCHPKRADSEPRPRAPAARPGGRVMGVGSGSEAALRSLGPAAVRRRGRRRA